MSHKVKRENVIVTQTQANKGLQKFQIENTERTSAIKKFINLAHARHVKIDVLIQKAFSIEIISKDI